MNLGPKPDCECTGEILLQVKKHYDLSDDTSNSYFRDKNIFTGAMASYIVIEQQTVAKSGNKRTKKKEVAIIHDYCPFCGKKYLKEEKQEQAIESH